MRHAAVLRSPDSNDSDLEREPTPVIRHNSGQGLGKPAAVAPPSGPALTPVPPGEAAPKIRAFDQKLGSGTGKEAWTRKPTTLGTGACHCKTFHCKMGEEGMTHLDRTINEWLDLHPEYEVKMVTMCTGEWKGKLTEPQLVVQVWV